MEEGKELKDIPVVNDEENEISDILEEMQKTNGKKIDITNKRIDFDKKTLKRLELMLPVYKEELGDNSNASKLYSFVVRKAINSLFEGEFKKKIEEL